MAPGRELIEFGNFVLDVTDRRLMYHGAGIPLSPKAHDVLVTLARHPGRVVTKDELLEQVWPDTFVNEGILTVHVSVIRKALNDEVRPSRYIETVSKSGYRFVAPVTTVVVDDAAATRERARPRPVQSMVASGREILLTGVSFRLSEAVSLFRTAIRLDPSYAAAHAALALARCAEATLYTVPQLEASAEAKPCALRALAMDSGSADAQDAASPALRVSRRAGHRVRSSGRRTSTARSGAGVSGRLTGLGPPASRRSLRRTRENDGLVLGIHSGHQRRRQRSVV